MRPRDPGGAGSRPLRPRQRGAVGLRRVGGGEHERLRLLPVPRPQLAQALDRAAERELRAAEALDEVAAAARAERLERTQLGVDRAVAAGDALAADGVARDDPLPLEQQLRERPPVGLGAGEEGARRATSGPASRSRARADAREAARAPVRPRRLVPPLGAQRRPRVVRDLAGPDEPPERGQRHRVLSPVTSSSSGQKRALARERAAERVVHLALDRLRARRRAEQRRVLAEEDGDPVEAGADPDELARRAECVELLRPVAPDPRAEHLGFPERDGQRQALQRTRAPRAAKRAGRSRASSAGSGPAPPAPPARPRGAAPRARRGAGGAGPRGRTTRARVPPGRSSPRTSLSPRSSSRSTGSTSRPNHAPASPLVNGPRPRAQRRTSDSSASGAASRNASGRPDGGIAPSASR